MRYGIAFIVLCVANIAHADGAFTATAVTEFVHPAAPPMRMPTDVAVDADGAVYVADGVNDRILRFDAGGAIQSEIRQVGDESLSRPIGVAVDGAGRLWIADTGHGRVLVRNKDGELERTIVPQVEHGEHAFDITDIAVNDDGNHAWMVDNDNHRLIRVELETGSQSTIGSQGESLGQLKYPFMISLGPEGALLTTDVINARIDAFSRSGEPERTIGTFGVNPGQLYRPKGVVCDADGNVWVSDGTMGVVQVFGLDGTPIDVLRGDDGQPIHFQSPMGIAIQNGNLYVTELAANRVRKLKIVSHRTTPPRGPAERRDRIVGHEARACTICHIEWIEPFSKGVGTPLMNVPESTDEQPFVSRSQTCLSCHDGSVADSRRRVWQEHGHQTGMKPPDSMKVPPNLPLVNGKIACRTCHSAHAEGRMTGDLRGSIFLRVPNPASQLCMSCHADKTRGPQFGTHPTGGMPWPVPQDLIKAGARVGPNPREITCQVCHTPHGAGHEHLLVLGTESNQLCLECHDQMRPGMFREGEHTEHPITPLVNAAQKAAIERMGTRVGPGDHLICLSCHKLHHGKGERFMLAEDLTDGRMCLQCHPDMTSVFDTSHDLRKKFPEERNRLGMTPKTGGPCSACHLFHRYARPPETHEFDPRGLCITCHQKGRVAQAKSLGPISHPNVDCAVCHNPHGTDEPNFLMQPAANLCAECHEIAEDLVGVHAFEDRPDIVNARGQNVEDVGACLVCHSMHYGVAKPLWGMSAKPPATEQQKCTVCHKPGGFAPTTPVGPPNHTLACTECHGPHGDSDENPALLIVEPPAQQTCIRCHGDHEALVGGPHDCQQKPSVWPKASVQKEDRCLACHRPHQDAEAGFFRIPPPKDEPGPERACLACHSKCAPDAESPVALVHPRSGPLLNDQHELPLATTVTHEPRLTCKTCHNPHAAAGPGSKLFRIAPEAPGEQLCLTCHRDKANVLAIGHDAKSLQAAGLEAGLCLPCHAVHADPKAIESELMWPKRLFASALDGASVPFANRHCRACHRQGGPVERPAIAEHPNVAMLNLAAPEEPGFLPLFNEKGDIDPQGTIACRTCHLTHASGEPRRVLKVDPAVSPRGLRARKWYLREFGRASVCIVCHGFEGRRRFLYFHDPDRRGGPIRGGAAVPEKLRPP